ncbi:MAG: type VI secretion system tip protein VgrG [Holosporales bacterium]|jgi:type VI secretion system secreted protein VgrG|nr:type VI secretion system tip protein VgrG [Holosporales bacterium]
MFEAVDPEIKLLINGKWEKDLHLRTFTGAEAMSELFCFTLTCVSKNTAFDGKGAIGKPLSLSFALAKKERFFHGIITEFVQDVTVKIQNLPLTKYIIRICPRLHLLTLGSDYRIYQKQSTIEIIKSVLKENGVTDVKDKTQKHGHEVRTHCVHYGETFFAFFSRLCEEEGISYHFQHSADMHTLVLTDAPSAFSPISGEHSVPLLHTLLEKPPINTILSCSVHDHIVTKEFEALAYNYENPKTKLDAHVQGKGHHGVRVEYPGHFSSMDQGTQLANVRIQELEASTHLLEGQSTVLGFTTGAHFELTGHPRSEVNEAYTLLRVQHHFSIDDFEEEQTPLYQNEFLALPKAVAFSPHRKTLKNRIFGAQSAIVTGPEKSEIHRGPCGSIKVHFLWDKHNKMDDSSSWWVRTAQSFASQQYGGLITPRVADEVLVVFEEGDPEKPVVVGGVYNGENPPPYPEKEATRYGLKTHSSPQAEGFNECFFDDKAGEEKGYLHLQKDGEVMIENSLKHTVNKGDEERSYTEGSRLTLFEAKGDNDGNDTLHLKRGVLKIQNDKGNYELTLGEGDAKFAIKGATDWQVEKSHTASVKENAKIEIKGDLTIEVTGKILVQGKDAVTIKSSKDFMIQAGTNLTLKAGQNIQIQSGQDTSIQAGKNLKQTASMNIDIAAKMNYSAKASMIYKAEGQLNAEIKAGVQLKLGGTAIENQAQAMFKVSAPMIAIGGGMIKLG